MMNELSRYIMDHGGVSAEEVGQPFYVLERSDGSGVTYDEEIDTLYVWDAKDQLTYKLYYANSAFRVTEELKKALGDD